MHQNKTKILISLFTFSGLVTLPGLVFASNFEQALRHYQDTEYEEALTILEQLNTDSPTNNTSRLLALTYFELQDFQTATPLLEQHLQKLQMKKQIL